MKILFTTTRNPNLQGDLTEISVLNGMRKLMGDDFVDFPRKKIMYHDWSETTRDSLHGFGFNLLTYPIQDVDENKRKNFNDFDVVLHGCGWIYGENELQFDNCKNTWWIDGNDLYGHGRNMINYNGKLVIGNQKYPSFKREIIIEEDGIYPTAVGIPSWSINPINFEIKNQLYQSTVPSLALFGDGLDLGNRSNYKFTDEREYNKDLQSSWFGLVCQRGGWESFRLYEIIANGTLVLYRDYNLKPKNCPPHDLPCISYSTKEELYSIMSELVVNNKPTDTYINILNAQRNWLINHGTCEARAKEILKTLTENYDKFRKD